MSPTEWREIELDVLQQHDPEVYELERAMEDPVLWKEWCEREEERRKAELKATRVERFMVSLFLGISAYFILSRVAGLLKDDRDRRA